MQTISIQTAHNVTIEYEIASVGDRILASLIDLFVQIAYLIMIGYILTAIKFNVSYWFLIIVYLPVIFYEITSEILLGGQTLGKRAMSIQVVMLDGSQPSIANYFLRWLLRLFEVGTNVGIIAIIAIAVSKKGQRIGDIAAGTSVIKQKSRFKMKRPSLDILEEETYLPLFPEVIQLSDTDINIAREVLAIYQRTNNIEVIKNLNYKLREVLGIYHVNSFSELNFLRQIIRDYENLTAK
jgi:uncharacterized RDD family membrane protein YckC